MSTQMHSASIEYKQTKQCQFISVIASSVILIKLEKFVGMPAEPPTFFANLNHPFNKFFTKQYVSFMWTPYMCLTYNQSPFFWTYFVEISTLLIFIKFVAPCRFSAMLIHNKSYIIWRHEWAFPWSPQTWKFMVTFNRKNFINFYYIFSFFTKHQTRPSANFLPYSDSDLLYSVRQEFGHSLSTGNENNDHNSERITKDVKGITEFRVDTVWVIQISSTHTHTHTHTHLCLRHKSRRPTCCFCCCCCCCTLLALRVYNYREIFKFAPSGVRGKPYKWKLCLRMRLTHSCDHVRHPMWNISSISYNRRFQETTVFTRRYITLHLQCNQSEP
jgi:hypothetical protein